MTPLDILERLASHGLTLSLRLWLDGEAAPPDELEWLIVRHRDDLIIYLAMQLSDTPQMCRLSEELTEGSVWCRHCYRYHLKPCVPSDKHYSYKGVN